MIKKTAFFLAFMLCISSALFAAPGNDDLMARDKAVDAALIKNAGWAGVMPPTRGQGTLPANVKASGPAGFVNTTFPQPRFVPGLMTNDRTDKKAQIYQMKGTVKVSKKNSGKWEGAREGMMLEEGDALLTEKGSWVSIAFDRAYGNVTHIPENTRAVFKTIEPTEVTLEDGTIYNLFDALPKNSQWKVSSPAAVAAVRGTYYVVNYAASNGDYFAATFEVPDDDHESLIRVTEVKNAGDPASVDIPEGFQLNLKAGDTPSPSLLKNLDPIWFEKIMQVLEDLARRRNSGRQLPATSGEFFEPGNNVDPAGADAVGGGSDNSLDPFVDTGTPDSIDEPSSSSPSEQEPPPTQIGGEGSGGEEGCGANCV